MEFSNTAIDPNSRLLARLDGVWTDIDGQKPDGVEWGVFSFRVMAEGPDGRLYRMIQRFDPAFPDFDQWDIFVYDGEDWEEIPGTLFGTPFAMAIAANGDIYVGGAIEEVDGMSVANIAFYDISAGAWTAMEDGLGNSLGPGTTIVNDMVFHPSGDLYIGGFFDTDGGAGTENYKGVVRWDGSSFHAIGGVPSGVTSPSGSNGVISLRPSLDGAYVYLGGNFDTNGDASVTLNNIARYVVATDTIEAMGNSANPGFNSSVSSLDVAPDNSVYMVGVFSELATGEAMPYVSRWNGSAFELVGTTSDFTFTGTVITVDQTTGLVYADGLYFRSEEIGVTTNFGLVVWNGSVWTPADLRINGNNGAWFTVNIIISGQGDIYYGVGANSLNAYTYEVAALNIVDNPGTAPVAPTITLEGGEGRLSWLENLSSGQRVFFDYDIIEGETLTIDLGAGTVISSFYGSVLRAVLRNSDFGSFELLPGENRVLLLISESFEVEAVGSLVPRHWSIDALGR